MQRAVTLRPAEEADRPFLYQVYADTRLAELAPLNWSAEQLGAFLTMQFEAQDRHYRTHYPGAEFLVVQVDGAPAGRLYVMRWPQELRLMDIALLRPYRNQGIGTALIRDLLAAAQAEQRTMTVHVEPFNPALRLYQRLGFAKVEERGIYWFMQRLPETVGD